MTSRRHKAEPGPGTGPYPAFSTSGGPGQRQKEALGSSVQAPLAMVRLVGKSVGERGRILCSCPGVLADTPGAPRASGSSRRGPGWISHQPGKEPSQGDLKGQCQGSPRVSTPNSPLPGPASLGISHSPKPSHMQLGAAEKCPKIIKPQPTDCTSLDW